MLLLVGYFGGGGVVAMLHGLWDLSSLTRIQTHARFSAEY